MEILGVRAGDLRSSDMRKGQGKARQGKASKYECIIGVQIWTKNSQSFGEGGMSENLRGDFLTHTVGLYNSGRCY